MVLRRRMVPRRTVLKEEDSEEDVVRMTWSSTLLPFAREAN